MGKPTEEFPLWDLRDPAHADRFRALVENLLEQKAIITTMNITFSSQEVKLKILMDDQRLLGLQESKDRV